MKYPPIRRGRPSIDEPVALTKFIKAPIFSVILHLVSAMMRPRSLTIVALLQYLKEYSVCLVNVAVIKPLLDIAIKRPERGSSSSMS